jgi:hypothetical protein
MTTERTQSMKLLLRQSRLAILGALLALGSLTFATGAAPAAHAANQPSITAQGGTQYVSVTGSSFTPNGKVLVEVFDSNWNFTNSTTTTAAGPHVVCRLTGVGALCSRDPGGEINTISYAPIGSGTFSNWSTTYVRIIP